MAASMSWQDSYVTMPVPVPVLVPLESSPPQATAISPTAGAQTERIEEPVFVSVDRFRAPFRKVTRRTISLCTGLCKPFHRGQSLFSAQKRPISAWAGARVRAPVTA